MVFPSITPGRNLYRTKGTTQTSWRRRTDTSSFGEPKVGIDSATRRVQRHEVPPELPPKPKPELPPELPLTLHELHGVPPEMQPALPSMLLTKSTSSL